MAPNEPIKITCPECKKSIAVPQELIGKKVRCKGCSKVFQAEMPAQSKTAPAKESEKKKQNMEDEDDDGKAYGVTEMVIAARCPNCAEVLLSADDIVCILCGYNNLSRQTARTKRTFDTSQSDIFFWNLPGIFGAIICLILLTCDIIYLWKIDEWCIVPEGAQEGPWYSFLAHGSIKLWFIIISLFILFGVGKFSFTRLVLDNKPREQEVS